jgi:16S rRNA (cytosine1402-N4)-methyltransferase
LHQPVLLEETVSHLVTDPDGVYVDCTVGGGGHLKYLLSKLTPRAQIIGLDKDADILRKTQMSINAPSLKLVHADFRFLSEVLAREGIGLVDGIMIDLGVSSFQLDNAERGFSFHEDSRLDMRMNQEQAFSAWDLINSYSEEEISDILFKYGEEKHARRIARGIVQYRGQKTIDSTLELVDIIKSSVPAAYRREKHPARKSFQAIRIAVNGELDALNKVLPQAIQALKVGGKLCVITFHSLEDRIVKHFMQENARECICPPGLPICVCNHKPQLGIITRKPIAPGEKECEFNPRARSARLRVAVKK